MSRLSHPQIHMVHRIGLLRAAVLGANDGLVSTSSLVAGVAAGGLPAALELKGGGYGDRRGEGMVGVLAQKGCS